MGSLNKKTVFIDMDGVLVNYEKYYKSFNDLNFEDMEPIEGSIDAFHELNKNHDSWRMIKASIDPSIGSISSNFK